MRYDPHYPQTPDQIAREKVSAVEAGATQYRARSPGRLVFGPIRETVTEANADADALDSLFLSAPKNQWGAVAIAAMSITALLTGCTQQHTGALIWAIGEGVAETGSTR